MSKSMAAGVGEEEEYESDPEEAKLSLKMRRREASDDEEERRSGGSGEHVRRENPARRIDSDVESDQGGYAEYDEEEEDEGEEESEYLEDYEEEYVGEEFEEAGVPVGVEVVGEARPVGMLADGGSEVIREGLAAEVTELGDGFGGNDGGNMQNELEEKKENEPYAVPTAGAFYMHDDRFRDNSRGRQRRTFGGRKLWESRDDKKWGHDKFEELTTEDRHYYGGRRSSRGRYHGHGKTRGTDLGYPRGRRPRAYGNENNYNNENRVYGNNQKTQNNAPRVRGRGPRRYRPVPKASNDAPPPLNKRSGTATEKPSHGSSGKGSVPDASNTELNPEPPSKQGFVSSLNYASPPFYPSNTKDMNATHDGELQSGSKSHTTQSSRVSESSSAAQPSSLLRGKNVIESVAMDKLNINDSVSLVAGKPLTTMPVIQGSSYPASMPHRAQGRGITPHSQMNFQPTVLNSQVIRTPHPMHFQTMQGSSVQSRGQPSLQATGQQYIQRPGAGSQALSPPKNGQPIIVETGELESSLDASKLNTAVTKGKGSMIPGGRGSIVYGGAQVMGAPGRTGSGRGDQNFSATPAFLPVMQFGGQHPGGMGVPAVGMAFPGYMAQPQLGLGSSEMTWLPVLAGAAGALGAQYCSPYIAVDGAYHGRPSGQVSAINAASSKENNNIKVNNDGKPSQKPELGNDDFGQRQKNPRRYTEMKFDQ
ncbi:unnamed protein product [Cuscuta campestris]|uniref:Btz domain-containing protein n=1 Tax=Cuscuta campestris TaxID=132261 RepID=A0A484M6Z5_9ASTE|nr:unnamed protein product [Cuscuta campestris]